MIRRSESRVKRILFPLLVILFVFTLARIWDTWRKVDISMTFHYGSALNPPVALSLRIEDELGSPIVSAGMNVDYPIAPSIDFNLRPGKYRVIGEYTDSKGAKTQVRKTIDIPADHAQIDVYF